MGGKSGIGGKITGAVTGGAWSSDGKSGWTQGNNPFDAVASGMSMGLSGGMPGLINGKKKTYNKDPLANDINNLGKIGIGNLRAGADELNKVYANPQASIANQIGIENKLMRGATDDAARRTQQLIAQRGMGSSSIGLGQEINQNKLLSDKLAMNNASGMQRLMEMNKERMNLGNTLLAPKLGQGPIQMRDISQRVGGLTGQGGVLDTLAPFAGAAATAYAGRK